jgi:hypothetical protein
VNSRPIAVVTAVMSRATGAVLEMNTPSPVPGSAKAAAGAV